jgi:hypothetical protein
VVNKFGGIFRIGMLVIHQRIEPAGILKVVHDITGIYVLVTSVKKQKIRLTMPTRSTRLGIYGGKGKKSLAQQ